MDQCNKIQSLLGFLSRYLPKLRTT